MKPVPAGEPGERDDAGMAMTNSEARKRQDERAGPLRYRSRPTEVEAVQWTGTNVDEILAFAGDRARVLGELELLAGVNGAQGWRPVPIGDWVARNPGDGTDYWPVDPARFARVYEPIR